MFYIGFLKGKIGDNCTASFYTRLLNVTGTHFICKRQK